MQVVDGELVEISKLDNVPSGVVIDNPIELAIVDVDGNIMTSDSTSSIKITEIEDGTKISGQNTVVLNKGRASFVETTLYASPGKENVKFKLSSSAIDYNMVNYLDSMQYETQTLLINFRWCKPGEIVISDV